MITWFTGNTGSGKTTASHSAAKFGDIILDGDNLRKIWTDLGFSEKDRREQSRRTARLANYLNQQGINIFVSVIAPYRDLREEIKKICNCKFIYVPGGKIGKEYPYEPPDENTEIVIKISWKKRHNKICKKLKEKYSDCYPYDGIENHNLKAKDIDIRKEFADES